MLVFAGPLTATTFGYGKFTARDVEMASYALMAYSWGLIGFSLVKVLAPGYFARQDTKTPVRVGLIALGCNMAINLAVVLPAKWLGFSDAAHPAGHVHLYLRRHQYDAAVARAGQGRGLQTPGGLGSAAGSRAVRQRRHGGAAALVGRATRRTGWRSPPGSARCASRSACSAAAAAYFAALFLSGMRLAQMRGGHA